MITGVLAVAAAGYVAVLGALYAMQSRMIHVPDMPGRELVGTPSAFTADWEDVTLETADGVRLHGWYVAAEDDGAGPVVLFFHGNAGNVSHRLESLELFHDLGVSTLIIDYRGYGRSEGAPSEAGLYRDAEAAYAHLVESRGVEPGRVVPFGRSLGGAVAAYIAAEHPVGGLILESAFTSVPDRGAELYPIFPVRWLARLDYPTERFLRRVDAPVLVVHSEDDRTIPIHHGEALFEAAPRPCAFLRIRGDHNRGFMESGEEYVDGLGRFFESCLGQRGERAQAP